MINAPRRNVCPSVLVRFGSSSRVISRICPPGSYYCCCCCCCFVIDCRRIISYIVADRLCLTGHCITSHHIAHTARLRSCVFRPRYRGAKLISAPFHIPEGKLEPTLPKPPRVGGDRWLIHRLAINSGQLSDTPFENLAILNARIHGVTDLCINRTFRYLSSIIV